MRNYRFLCSWGVEDARFNNAAQAQAFADRLGARSFYAI